MWPGRGRTFQKIFPLILLGMILMRLIWMQLRTFPTEYETRAIASLVTGTQTLYNLCPRGTPGGMQSSDLLPPGIDNPDVNLLSPAFAGTGLLLCQFDQLDSKTFVRLNQFLFCASILAAVMLTRFVTSSWMLSLIVAAMLFSRGMLLAEIGSVSQSYLIMFLLMSAFACFAHFFRSGSRWILILGAGLFSLLCLVDRSLWFLNLLPLGMLIFGWLVCRQLRVDRVPAKTADSGRVVKTASLSSLSHTYKGDFGSQFAKLAGTFRWFFGMEFGRERDLNADEETKSQRPEAIERGSLFGVLKSEFYNWLYFRQRGFKIAALLTLATLSGLLIDALLSHWMTGTHATGFITHLFPFSELLSVAGYHSQAMIWSQLDRVDMHLIVSFFILALCAVQHPRAGLPGFFELSLLVLLVCVGVALMSTFTDAAEFRWAVGHYKLGISRPLDSVYGIRSWMNWVEPLVLTMGVAGFYNLMKVLDTRIAGKTN